MNLNTIEKQLTDKSNEDINKCAQEIVHVLKTFSKDKTGKINSGINWPTNRTYDPSDGNFIYKTDHLNWLQLESYMSKMLRHEFLDDIVKQKTTTLLSKLELLD